MANADDPFLTALGQAMATHRTRAGLTQEAVAIAAGRHPKYLGPIERGERNVGIRTLRDFATGLGLELSELLEEVERLMAEGD